jgi:hypothetical protein
MASVGGITDAASWNPLISFRAHTALLVIKPSHHLAAALISIGADFARRPLEFSLCCCTGSSLVFFWA